MHALHAQAQEGFLEEAHELGHTLESDTVAQYWVRVGRQGQIPPTGSCSTFRMKVVSGETTHATGLCHFDRRGSMPS